jgi:hypothetical protein
MGHTPEQKLCKNKQKNNVQNCSTKYFSPKKVSPIIGKIWYPA